MASYEYPLSDAERTSACGAFHNLSFCEFRLVCGAEGMAAPRSFIVLDPFAGSGTTIIAAEKTRRLARVIEMDPIYVDVAIRRWQKLTKKTAILAGTQLTFFQIKADATECTAANCGVETEQ